jgi:2'-5' RNA ligase
MTIGEPQPDGHREQSPHITCARIKAEKNIRLGLPPIPSIPHFEITVNRIELWKSWNSNEGVYYESIAQFPLSA